MTASAPVLIMAGGTGGHIFPGLAVAERLREQGVPVAWLGARGGMEAQVVPAHQIPLHLIAVGGLRGKRWTARVFAPLMLVRALIAALRVLRKVRPRSVLSMGGYAAGPGGLAAWMLRMPLLVHEQNCVPGVTNRLLAHGAQRVLTGFSGAMPHAQWVGNPVRAAIAQVELPAARFATRSGRPRLLVLGGSLGARALNLALPRALAAIPARQRPDVFHQCGTRGLDEARAAYAAAGVEVQLTAFIEDMAVRYAWADLVVCRAGALTLAELTAVGLGALLVPFPYAVDDHQTRNAEALVAAGAAQIMSEELHHAQALDAEVLAGRLEAMLDSRAQLLAMAEAARALAKPDAAMVIARACVEVSA